MKQIAVIAGVCVALGATSIAYADDSASNAYGGAGGDVPTIVSTPPSQPPVTPAAVTPPAATPVAAPATPSPATPSAPIVAGAHAVKGASAQSAPLAVAAAPAATVTPARPTSAGALPFTGLDVTLMAAGGLLLIGLGVAMRRLSRRTAPLA